LPGGLRTRYAGRFTMRGHIYNRNCLHKTSLEKVYCTIPALLDLKLRDLKGDPAK
jgi:hypothetical protein